MLMKFLNGKMENQNLINLFNKLKIIIVVTYFLIVPAG